jgi:hypothetical protein
MALHHLFLALLSLTLVVEAALQLVVVLLDLAVLGAAVMLAQRELQLVVLLVLLI